MKKIKLLILPLLISALASCGNQASSSSLVSSESSTSEQVSISSQSEESKVSSSSSSEREYPSDDWADFVKDDIALALGSDTSLPFYKTRSYSSKVGMENGTWFVQVTCDNVNVDTAISTYGTILQNQGFIVYEEETCFIGYKELNATDNLYIQFALNEENLVIFAYKQTVRSTTWDKASIKAVVGVELPQPVAESYQYGSSTATNGNPSVYAYCYKVSENYINDYANVLKELGYEITEVSPNDMYYAEDKVNEIRVTLYMYDSSTLFISVYSTKVITYWPSEDVKEILKEDLPVLSFEGVNYEVKVITAEAGFTIYTIYCHNVTDDKVLTDYVTALTDASWSVDSKTTPSEESPYTTYMMIKNKGTSQEHKVQLIYSSEYGSIAIGIYY